MHYTLNAEARNWSHPMYIVRGTEPATGFKGLVIRARADKPMNIRVAVKEKHSNVNWEWWFTKSLFPGDGRYHQRAVLFEDFEQVTNGFVDNDTLDTDKIRHLSIAVDGMTGEENNFYITHVYFVGD